MDFNRRTLLTTGGAAAAAAVGSQVLHAAPAGAVTLSPAYLPVGPFRVYDSRDGDGKLVRNEERTLVGGAIPEDYAHCFNLTITDTQGIGGFVALFPDDVAWDGTSSINWFGPVQTLANNAITRLGQGDQGITLRCGGVTGAATHIVLDLIAVVTLIDLDIINSAGVQSAMSAAADAAARQYHAV